MSRKRKSKFGLFLTFFLPAILLAVLAVAGIDAYVVNYLVHPKKKKVDESAPNGYAQVRSVYWESCSIQSNGQTLKGWVLVFGAGAPGIVLSHGYGSNREEILDLGYRLWERGFNVLLFDQRAHGENTAPWSSMGASEKDDLKAAVKYFKDIKCAVDGPNKGKISATGQPLVDPQNVGLYGVDFGAFTSLMVAADDDSIKGVVADAPMPSVPEYVHARVKQIFKVDSGAAYSLVDFGLGLYLQNKYDVGSALTAVGQYQAKGKKAMIVIGNDAAIFRQGAQRIFDRIAPPENKKLYTPEKSRVQPLYKEAADEYNNTVGSFFRDQVFPAATQLVDPATPNGTPTGTPAGTPAAAPPAASPVEKK